MTLASLGNTGGMTSDRWFIENLRIFGVLGNARHFRHSSMLGIPPNLVCAHVGVIHERLEDRITPSTLGNAYKMIMTEHFRRTTSIIKTGGIPTYKPLV